MAPDSPDRVQVACAFCDDGIPFTDQDPIALNVVEHWRPYDEAPDWTVYAHRRCLIVRLSDETQATLIAD